jgi:ATP-dependent Clp protease ATP-binding subunit ClpA
MNPRAGPALQRLASRLAPYARASFDRGIELAARIHAEELSSEHWLAALLADETCAARRAVLHAFADPETIGSEVLALCSGIMVVGSARTLPFSVLAVEALEAARELAVARGASRVSTVDVFTSARERVHPELAGRVGELREWSPATDDPTTSAEPPVSLEGPLFRFFSEQAKRAMSASARAAQALKRDAIAPWHLLQGVLENDAELRARTGLSAARLRLASGGLDEDRSALSPRLFEAEGELRTLLEGLPQGAGTLEVLAWILAHGNREVAALLQRQKVTEALVGRCLGVLTDPDLDGS